jgi:hypothetical protein
VEGDSAALYSPFKLAVLPQSDDLLETLQHQVYAKLIEAAMILFCRSLPVFDTWGKVQVTSPWTQEEMLCDRVNSRLPVFVEWPRSAKLDCDDRIVVDIEEKRKYEASLKVEEEKPGRITATRTETAEGEGGTYRT